MHSGCHTAVVWCLSMGKELEWDLLSNGAAEWKKLLANTDRYWIEAEQFHLPLHFSQCCALFCVVWFKMKWWSVLKCWNLNNRHSYKRDIQRLKFFKGYCYAPFAKENFQQAFNLKDRTFNFIIGYMCHIITICI